MSGVLVMYLPPPDINSLADLCGAAAAVRREEILAIASRSRPRLT